MRLSIVLAALVCGLGLAACEAEPTAPEPSLSPEQKALVEAARAALALAQKAEVGEENGQAKREACRSFFDAKKQLLDVESLELAALWSSAAGPCGDLSDPQKFMLERASKDLKALRAQVGSSQFDPQYFCVSVGQAQRQLRSSVDPAVQRLLAEGRKMCGLDAWTAFGTLQIDKLRAAREKDATARPAADCAYLQLSIDAVAPEFGSSPKLAALRSAYSEMCVAPKKS